MYNMRKQMRLFPQSTVLGNGGVNQISFAKLRRRSANRKGSGWEGKGPGGGLGGDRVQAKRMSQGEGMGRVGAEEQKGFKAAFTSTTPRIEKTEGSNDNISSQQVLASTEMQHTQYKDGGRASLSIR